MIIPLAVLADAANTSSEAKLNILGVFNVIYAQRFPAVHSQMQLVFSIEATSAEAGAKRKLEIKLMTEDGRQLFSLVGELAIGTKTPTPVGTPLRSNHIIGLQNVKFEKPGAYQFAILINDDEKRTVPLWVQERQPTTPD